VRRISGPDDVQIRAWEAQLEAQVVVSLQHVMDTIAKRIEAVQVASALVASRVVLDIWADIPWRVPVLVAAVTTGPTGDDDPPPQTADLAIPAPEPVPATIPDTPDLPPGQPWVSPDDLASIVPLWQEQLAGQIMPIVAQIFVDSALGIRTQLIDAAPAWAIPNVGSLAAEQYLATVRDRFADIGIEAWDTARDQLSEGFAQGESIPQLAARLRQSAGLTAREAVLVARTSVIDASNKGSIGMARASGLTMLKTWIATNDVRTRLSHLVAEERYTEKPIPLDEPFIVGGHPTDYPASPSLPPAEGYNCRCTVGYALPDQATATVGEPAALLPGTVEPPEPEILAKAPGEPGFDLADFPEPPPVKVRSALLRARTDRELIAAWQGEMRAITGRDIIVQLPPDASLLTMREHAEGVLQMLERFPEARLRKVSWYDAATNEYAHVQVSTATLEFNARWASTAMRRDYLAQLRHDVSGWDAAAGPGYGWSVRGARYPQATAWHEMAHILSIETLGGKLKAEAMRITLRRMTADGFVDMGDYVSRQISAYAATTKGHLEEMIAEAMTDVMANGPRASLLSRELYDMVAREYRARGFAVRTVDVPEGEAGFEEFTRETFPKAAAARGLASQTVAQLRALAKERGITVPAGTRKADLVRMLDERVPGTIPDVAGQIRTVPDATAVLPARVIAARAELERVAASPVVREPYSIGGSGAYNTRIGHEAGDVIEKDYTRGTKAAGVRDADAEELGALVMDALDVPTQTVLRAGPQRVIVSVLEGEHPEAIGPLATAAARRELADTDGGRLLGLADTLIANSDRRRNWVRLADGRPASYDLGGAFQTPKLAAAADPEGLFAHHFATAGGKAWAPNDMAPADLALIRTRLEALRPEFERLGRGTWHKQMMARLTEVEKRATGTRTRLAEAAGEAALSPEARAVARQAVIDERRAVADSLAEVRELLTNGASERALASRSRLIAGRTTGQAREDLTALVQAMESGDADRIRIALGDVAQRRSLAELGPAGQDVVPFDPKIHELVTGAKRPPAGTFVQVQRPGYSVRLDDGEVVQLSKAKVDTLTPEEIAIRTAAQERKAMREAARERNRVIEAQRGTARLLAEVDELAAKGASKTAIRERLDPALREAGQAYAGADPATVDTILAALDSGDMAKIRASVTRASTKAKIKPIGRAGAKTTFDPDTMEGVGGIEIAPGAKVTVVRRGSRLEGIGTPEKAQVTPVAAPARAAAVSKPFEVPSVETMAERAGVSRAEISEIRRLARTFDAGTVILGDDFDRRYAATFADSEIVKAFAQRHQAIYNRIIQEQAISRNWSETIAPTFARQGKTLAQIRAESVDKLRTAIEGQPVVIRRATETRLRQALDDGRLKTQFETGTSSGVLDTQMRANFEAMDFGYDPVTFPAAQRPVYGYVSVGGVRGASDLDGAVSGYGNIQIVLRDSVRPRITVTAGDSLDLRQTRRPSPIDRIDYRSTAGHDRTYDERWLLNSYVEAQIHGGVTWDDVAEVVFVRQPEPETVAALARRGVSWRILGPGQM
jgi:hypothetical protein